MLEEEKNDCVEYLENFPDLVIEGVASDGPLTMKYQATSDHEIIIKWDICLSSVEGMLPYFYNSIKVSGSTGGKKKIGFI